MSERPITVFLAGFDSEQFHYLHELLKTENDIRINGLASRDKDVIDKVIAYRPDIVLMDDSLEGIGSIAASSAIMRAVPSTAIIFVGDNPDSDKLRQAMHAGARDYIPRFPTADDFSLVRAFTGRQPPLEPLTPITAPAMKRFEPRHKQTMIAVKEAHLIVVYSMSGGAGKTTIATNVAAGLAQMDKRVLLIDAALKSGDVGTFLNLQSSFSIADLVANAQDLDSEHEIAQFLVNAWIGNSLSVLLAPERPEYAAAIPPEQICLMVERLSEQFDYIIIDTSSVLDDLTIDLFELAEHLLLVINPSLPDVRKIRTLLDMLKSLDYPESKVHIVFNRVDYILEKAKVAISVAAIEENLKMQALGVVSLDHRAVLNAVNRGIPVIARKPKESPAKELIELAERVRQLCEGPQSGEPD